MYIKLPTKKKKVVQDKIKNKKGRVRVGRSEAKDDINTTTKHMYLGNAQATGGLTVNNCRTSNCLKNTLVRVSRKCEGQRMDSTITTLLSRGFTKRCLRGHGYRL